MPLATGFLVDPIESRQQIEALLDLLPAMYAENPYGEVAIGAVVKGVLTGLVSRGVRWTCLRGRHFNACRTGPFADNARWPIEHFRERAPDHWTRQAQGSRRSLDLRYRQGATTIRSWGPLLAEYSRRTLGSRRWRQFIPVPREVHGYCFNR